MSHIFISYARKDIKFAEKIVQALENKGLDTWTDWKSIPKTVEWEEEIYRGIEEADAFLFMVSPDAVHSKMCNKELAHAVGNNKRIIPIVIRDTEAKSVPPPVSKLNWIFCRDGQDNFETTIELIQEVIHKDFKWLKYQTELQVKALKWDLGQDASRLLRGKELEEAEQQLYDAGGQREPQPTSLQRQYVMASRKYADRQRRLVNSISITVAIIMLILAIFGFYQADQAQQRAKIALARQLAAQSQFAFSKDPIVGMLLAVEALDLGPSLEAQQVINDGLAMYPSRTVQTTVSDAFSIIISPDEQTFALVGPNSISVREIASGIEVAHMTIMETRSAKYSEDGQFIYTLDRKGLVQIWKATTGQEYWHTQLEFDGSIYSAEFSSDGNTVILRLFRGIGLDDQLTAIDLNSGNHILDINQDISSLAISPDGQRIALGNWDGTIEILELNTGQIISKTVRPSEYICYSDCGVESLLFSSDGRWLTSIARQDSGDQIAIFDTETGVETAHKTTRSYQYPIRLSIEGTLLFSEYLNGLEQVEVWDIRANHIVSTVWEDNPAISVAISQDRRWLISIDEKNKLSIWDLSSRPEYSIINTDFIPLQIALSSDANRVAAGGTKGKVCLWSMIPKKEILCKGSKPEILIMAVATDSKGRWLTYGTNDGVVKVWEVDTNREIASYSWNQQIERGGIFFSSDEQKVISYGGSDLHILDIRDGTLVNPQFFFMSYLYGSIVSRSGKMIFSPIIDNGDTYFAFTWRLDNGQIRQIIFTDMLNKCESRTRDISSDGRKLVLACELDNYSSKESLIIVIDIGTGREIRRIVHDMGHIYDIAFSPDGKWILAGGDDGTARVWDVSNGVEVARVKHESRVITVTFSQNGRWVASGSIDGSIRIWPFHSEEIIAQACSRLPRNLTRAEWQHYITDTPYHATCPNLPIEPQPTAIP